MVTLFHHGLVKCFFVFVKSLALLTNSYRNKLHYPSKTNMAERLMALKTALTGLINDIIKLISGCSVLKDIMSEFLFKPYSCCIIIKLLFPNCFHNSHSQLPCS